MKKLIFTLIIISSIFGFSSCNLNDRKDYGRVISTEVVEIVKDNVRIGGHMSFFTGVNKYNNKIKIRTSDGSIKEFNIISENNPFNDDLVGDSVMIFNNHLYQVIF